jgi:hypothetical protein
LSVVAMGLIRLGVRLYITVVIKEQTVIPRTC